MSTRRVDPRDQFSKKLAKWSSWFWFVYMLLTLAAAVIQPLASDSAVYLAGFSSLVMILNLAAYTHNSVYDKAIAAGAKVIGRFRFSWKAGGEEDVPAEAESEAGAEDLDAEVIYEEEEPE